MTLLTRRHALAAAAALGVGAPAAAQDRPRRVVSINSCTDVMLLDLADPGQITALSHYCRQADSSTVVERARPYPITYESAEEVLALRPDLVLASRHNALATRQALTRLGIRVEVFATPETVDESLAQVRKVAGLVGHPERGAALVARIEAAFAAAAPRLGTRPVSTLIFQANGFTAGSQTLIGELMRRTGLANAADRYGLRKWGNVRLENLVADPPELLLGGQAAADRPTWADRLGHHPALAAISGRMARDVLPESLFLCGGSVFIPAVQRLAAVRDRYLAHRA
ncbi:MAG TPA: helical backbone metal receptor [Caulobacteraceae bacterium]|jgi:iron complex transport system substrate-binding protein|nr:helical backbone metal receptor [Caulobacteraceae bacterium]